MDEWVLEQQYEGSNGWKRMNEQSAVYTWHLTSHLATGWFVINVYTSPGFWLCVELRSDNEDIPEVRRFRKPI